VNGAIAHCPRHPLNYRSGHTRCEPALQQHSSMPTPQPPRNRRADRWHHFPRTRCGPSHNDPSDALGVPGRPQCTAWGSRCTLGRAGRTFDTPTVHPGVRKRPKGPQHRDCSPATPCSIPERSLPVLPQQMHRHAAHCDIRLKTTIFCVFSTSSGRLTTTVTRPASTT